MVRLKKPNRNKPKTEKYFLSLCYLFQNLKKMSNKELTSSESIYHNLSWL